MPANSVSTYASRSTIKTTSDVLDIVACSSPVSLKDTRRMVRKAAGKDTALAEETIKELQSSMAPFMSVCSVPDSLIRLMFDTNTYLGGIQATSFQHAICGVVDAPWDFFCSSVFGSPNTFVEQLAVMTGSDMIETAESASTDHKTYIFRKSVNGSNEPLTMRVFVSRLHPMDAILDLKGSHQQSLICAVGAVCFWPDMMNASPRKYRSFELNGGLNKYPPQTIKSKNRHSRLMPDSQRHGSKIHLFKGLSETEYVLFENDCGIDGDRFKLKQRELQDTVYAVSGKATKYLGNVSGM